MGDSVRGLLILAPLLVVVVVVVVLITCADCSGNRWRKLLAKTPSFNTSKKHSSESSEETC